MLLDSCPVCLSCPVCDIGALWPNGWTDQDEAWRAGRSWPWPHCVRWGPSTRSPKEAQPPNFNPYLLWPNCCVDQAATWYGGRPLPRRPCVRCRLRCPSPKRGQSSLPHKFLAHVCGQTAGWMKMLLGMEVGLSTGDFELDGDSAPLP